MVDVNQRTFNQKRSRFSDWIIQYGVIFCVLFCSVMAGAFWLINERHEHQFDTLTEYQSVTLSLFELERDWLLISESNEQRILELLQKEQHIVEHVQTFLAQNTVLPTPPISFNDFSISEQSKLAINRVQQIKQLIEQENRQLFVEPLLDGVSILVLLLSATLLLVYLIWGWRRILRDRKSALAYFHSQVDKAQNGSLQHSAPLDRQDEFGDFARYLESILFSMLKDLDSQTQKTELYRDALSSSLSLKLVMNAKCEIVSVSDGLSSLWVTDSAILADFLGVDEQLVSLEGEIVSEDFLNKTEDIIRIGRKHYAVRKMSLGGAESLGYLIELVAHDVHHEIKALEAVLSLMVNDVWDAPIRILDTNSPYYSFSKKLETLRQNVVAFLADFNAKSEEIDKEYPKVTKLQQLLALLVARLKQTRALADDYDVYQNKVTEDVDSSKQQFLRVREQIEYRFELYEAYLQQLVAWQASQGTWVETVHGGLVDTKNAVLNLLSLVHSDHTSTSVIEHSVIDLVHDIDTVLVSIVDGKPVENQLGLEHIKSSESDLMRRLNEVQNTLDRLSESISNPSKIEAN